MQTPSHLSDGRKVMAAGARFPIPVALELGGIDAMVVLEDADIEFTAAAIAWGVTFNGGQACCSVERVIVHSSIQEALQARVADKMRRIDVRHDLGPAIDDRQLEIWAGHVNAARNAGLDVDCGGERLGNRRYSPTLISGEGVRGLDAAARARHAKCFADLTLEQRRLLVDRAGKTRVTALRTALNGLAALVEVSHFGRRDYLDKIGVPDYVNTDREPTPAWMANVATPDEIPAANRVECDVVVVGTGAGGAAAAVILVEQGLAVVMVEEGHYARRADRQAGWGHYRDQLRHLVPYARLGPRGVAGPGVSQ